MSEEAPKAVDPAQVAQTAALEDAPVVEPAPAVTVPIEIQQDVQEAAPNDAGDDTPPPDSHIEERIQELRDRGRVGVLTEGTERPDTSGRMKNSDHDPEAIAAANKANRVAQTQRGEHLESLNRDKRLNIGRNFATATERKLEAIEEGSTDSSKRGLTKYFEDPEGWESETRERMKNNGYTEDEVERSIGLAKRDYNRTILEVGDSWDKRREGWLQGDYEELSKQTKDQDQFRGDLLDLYARDPEKYKAMTAEEFVAAGREFRIGSTETSKLASLEAWGISLDEKLPSAVEEATSIADFCEEMNNTVNTLRYRIEAQGMAKEELYSFVEAIEGIEVPGRETVPEKANEFNEESKQAYEAYMKGQEARRDTKDRIREASMYGYFRVEDFAKDLDRSPREQMREAAERVKAVTSKWIEDGQKARAEFDERWGKAPEDDEPKPEAA